MSTREIIASIVASGWSISTEAGRLVLDGEGDLPAEIVEHLRDHREEVLTLLEAETGQGPEAPAEELDLDHAALVEERVRAFSAQATTAGGQPLFVLPGAETASGCLSCGRPLAGLFRCSACAEAARIVLGLRLEPDSEIVAALFHAVEDVWQRAALARRPPNRAADWLRNQARRVAPELAAADLETLVLRTLGRLCNGPDPGGALARETWDVIEEETHA